MRENLARTAALLLAAGLLAGCTGPETEGERTPGETVRAYEEARERRLKGGSYRTDGMGRVLGKGRIGDRDLTEEARRILEDTERDLKDTARVTGRAAHELGREAESRLKDRAPGTR